MASTQMDALYVIFTNMPSPGELPMISARFPMLDESGNSQGLSIELLNQNGVQRIRLTTGNKFNPDTVDIVRSGRIVVETQGGLSGNTLRKINAYFNGARIDKGNLTLTAAGIGITDILSGDPLIVDLVTAPLTTMKDPDGNTRTVAGVYIEYVDSEIYDYSVGYHTAKIWGIQTMLVK